MAGRTEYVCSLDMDSDLMALLVILPQLVGSCLAYTLRMSLATVGHHKQHFVLTHTVGPPCFCNFYRTRKRVTRA